MKREEILAEFELYKDFRLTKKEAIEALNLNPKHIYVTCINLKFFKEPFTIAELIKHLGIGTLNGGKLYRYAKERLNKA
jgi:hypothetical protein